MNLRVRRVTGESLSAIFAVVDVVGGRAVGRVVQTLGKRCKSESSISFSLAEDHRREGQAAHAQAGSSGPPRTKRKLNAKVGHGRVWLADMI